MVRFFSYIYFILILFLCSCGTRTERILFAKGSKDWLRSGDVEWKFDEGELIGYAKENGGFVMTEDQFGNFILKLEFYPDETVNSGVFARCSDFSLSAEECYEFNIWDEHPDQPSRTGAVVSRSSPLSIVHTIDRWNTYKIKCEGGVIQAWINDVKVAQLNDEDLKTGYIGLQVAGKGTIRFRSIRIEELSP